MNEPEDPSYYEIALTNRQVLTGFVILLVCVALSFFAGLWVGRGGTAPAVPAPPPEVANAEPEEALEEFRFFSEEKAGKPEVEEIEVPASRPAASPPPPPPPRASAPPQEPPPQTDETEEPPPRRPRAVPEDPPPQQPPAIPRTTARRPDESAEATELFVQVFSTHDESQARKVLRRLLDGGFSAFLSPADVGERTTYRVRIGPFADREAASEVAAKVQKSFKLDTWITT